MKLKPLNDLAFIEKVSSFHKGQKYLVGGCVRDWLLGLKCFDLDFLFDKNHKNAANKTAKEFSGKVEYFDKFLTARVFCGQLRADFASFRKEKYEKPAALPKVFKALSLKEELKRRDFTINSMALSLNKQDLYEIKDPYGGYADLKNKKLRILHEKSFQDDPTRIFRAARFCARFKLSLDKKTFLSLKSAIKNKNISLLSAERKRNELIKILSEEKSFAALSLLKKWKALEQSWPFVSPKKEIDMFKSAFERLVFLAASTPAPKAFILSLNLPAEEKKNILNEIKPFDIKRNPAHPSELQAKIYKILYSKELKPLFLSFADINVKGFSPQKSGEIMDKISSMQWLGKIKSKKEAENKILTEKI
ncbi:MAG: hypothetical protein AB1637_01705 [Elusimicrobiota bacterium]